MPRRIYLDLPMDCGQLIALPAEAHHYLRNVLRLHDGDEIHCFNGNGAEFSAILCCPNRKTSELMITSSISVSSPSPLHIRLVLGISKGDHMDYAIQKSTELGVSEIVPLITDFSSVAHKSMPAKQAHWRGVLIHACQQCGRADLPQLQPAQTLADYLTHSSVCDLRLILSLNQAVSIANIKEKPASVELLIGPEGGWSAAEEAWCQQQQFIALSLGPRVLRTETAAATATALIQARWGDLA